MMVMIILTITMNNVATSWEVYPSFAECIPPGQDIYVLTTQNYNIPQPYGYYFSGICYWVLSLQLFFGPNFEVVIHGIANKVGIIIFVRKDLVWKINNPSVRFKFYIFIFF
jgi:hypothetical protein